MTKLDAFSVYIFQDWRFVDFRTRYIAASFVDNADTTEMARQLCIHLDVVFRSVYFYMLQSLRNLKYF